MSQTAKPVPFSSEPARGWLPWALLAPVLCVVFVAVPVLATSDLLEQAGFTDARGDPIGTAGLIVFLVPPFALTGLLTLAWVLWVERRPLASIGLARQGGGAGFLRGVAIGCLTITAVVAGIWMAGGYRPAGLAPASGSPTDLANIGLLLLAFALQASVEEVLFRGWLMSLVARKLNILVAVLVTGVVFSLLHFSPGQPLLVTLNIFLFSTFACCWALRAGNIWGVMGWHAGWNWLLATGFEVPVTGLEAGTSALLVKLVPEGVDWLTGGAQGPEGSWICGVFFAVSSLWLLRPRKVRRSIPNG